MPAIELGRYLRASEQRYHTCIEACVACWLACEMCSDACLDEEKVQKMVRCIRLNRDCADACRMAAEAMVRGGENVAEICRLCAELCEKCAAECEKHDHEHCRVCAEACHRCAEECREMAG